jgi:hypothetical protein
MAVEMKEMKYAKELGDVWELLYKAVEMVAVEKKGASEMAMLLPELVEAINGADQIDNEMKEDLEAVMSTCGMGAMKIAAMFLKKK